MKEIDVRGLSCPEPVLIVMDQMDAWVLPPCWQGDVL